MTTYKKFYDSLIPGNYALTKSMELTKKNKSGSLWYMYKFLVLYYYIFLTNTIETREYIMPIIKCFDNYINTLPNEVQKSAQEFFYSNNSTINFKSESFKSFKTFAAESDFDTATQRVEYFSRAKKCYFALLMNSGGQSGIKKAFMEALEAPGFVYSINSAAEILFEASIKSIIEDANKHLTPNDNSIKEIISETAVKKIIELSHDITVTYEEAVKIAKKYPLSAPNYKMIENDAVAFIRNERQILYYYGYFHSKSSGASDKEFSSLTPVGELSISANSTEFAAIWEHQKIKMVSQPVTVDIQNVTASCEDAEKFALSFTPYTDILGHIARNKNLSGDEYQYVVSRKKNLINENEWQDAETEILQHINELKDRVQSFNRRRDVDTEDSRKEFLKYILGLRSDLPFDKGQNILNILTYTSKGIIKCDSQQKLQLIYQIYKKLDEYKIEKYGDLFKRCENDLKSRYKDACLQVTTKPNAQIKIEWDLYNIHTDKLIYMSVAIATAAANIGITRLEDITAENVNAISEYCSKNYAYSFKALGVSGSQIVKEISKVLNALIYSEYASFITEDKYTYSYSFTYYSEYSCADLLKKIKEVSANANSSMSDERKRNGSLVNLIKSYLKKRNGDEKLKCECCGNETFLTEAGDFYIELHHLIPFKKASGPDHYLNMYALCPNCHRKFHYLNLNEKGDCYMLLNVNNFAHKTIMDRLQTLKNEHLLRSYHLEYLLADKAITQSEYDSIA